MSQHTEALKLAIDAIEAAKEQSNDAELCYGFDYTLGKLRAALAEPAQECDSPRLCKLAKGCAGQYGTEKICSHAAPTPAQPDGLIPQDALFVCPQMGNSVTRVTAQPARLVDANKTMQPAEPLTGQLAQEILEDMVEHMHEFGDGDLVKDEQMALECVNYILGRVTGTKEASK